MNGAGTGGAIKSPNARRDQRAVDTRAISRRMRLTPELVSKVARHVDDPGPMPGRVYAGDADYEATTRDPSTTLAL